MYIPTYIHTCKVSRSTTCSRSTCSNYRYRYCSTCSNKLVNTLGLANREMCPWLCMVLSPVDVTNTPIFASLMFSLTLGPHFVCILWATHHRVFF